MNWSFSVSSCNKRLFQKGIICLNLVRIWYIFPTHTFVLNAVKEPEIFFGGGGWVCANKSLLDFSPSSSLVSDQFIKVDN